MAGVNKVIILGRLGADPDLRSSPSGVTSCRLKYCNFAKLDR